MPLAQQLVQAMHASHMAGLDDSNHYQQIPSIILFQVANQHELKKELAHLQSLGITCSQFHEPYADMGLTAFATLPVTEDKRHLFSSYSLWGRGMKEHNEPLANYLKEERKQINIASQMKKNQSIKLVA